MAAQHPATSAFPHDLLPGAMSIPFPPLAGFRFMSRGSNLTISLSGSPCQARKGFNRFGDGTHGTAGLPAECGGGGKKRAVFSEKAARLPVSLLLHCMSVFPFVAGHHVQMPLAQMRNAV